MHFTTALDAVSLWSCYLLLLSCSFPLKNFLLAYLLFARLNELRYDFYYFFSCAVRLSQGSLLSKSAYPSNTNSVGIMIRFKKSYRILLHIRNENLKHTEASFGYLFYE